MAQPSGEGSQTGQGYRWLVDLGDGVMKVMTDQEWRDRQAARTRDAVHEAKACASAVDDATQMFEAVDELEAAEPDNPILDAPMDASTLPRVRVALRAHRRYRPGRARGVRRARPRARRRRETRSRRRATRAGPDADGDPEPAGLAPGACRQTAKGAAR